MRRFLLLLFLLLILGTGIYALESDRAHKTIDLTTLQYEEKTPYWENRIRDLGAGRAFEEFKASIESVPPVERHWELHLFGNALYDVGGLDLMATCDSSLDNACFHSFMISGIEEFGVDAASRLHDVCVAQLGGKAFMCLHGLGHALLGVFGYTEEGLARSLEICDENMDQNPISIKVGCHNGAFMEFNSPMDITGYVPRSFTEESAYEPCLSLTNRNHRRACTFAQLYWWFSSLKHEEPAVRLAHIGKLCRGMNPNDEEMYTICLQGAGNALDTTIDYDPSKVAEACTTIDPAPQMRMHCQKNAAIRLSFYFPLEKATLACDGLPAVFGDQCREGLLTSAKAYSAQKLP